MPAEQDQSNSDDDQKDSEPSLPVYPFPKEDSAAEGADNIAQSRYRHYETDVEDRQRSQQGEECCRHHSHTQPHPGHTKSAQNQPGNVTRPKAPGFTNHFHRS